MYARHVHADFKAGDATFVYCPSCGSDDPDDNRLDEALHAEAAREVPRLRFEGKIDEAIDVLSALFARRILNLVNPRWRCHSCGAAFDD